MSTRLLIAGRLLLRFIVECGHAGLTTACIMLRRAPAPAGFVRLRFAPMSERGAAVLGALVTLTPGSTLVDIDMVRREMLLHLLDLGNAEASLAVINRKFERDIALLFPEESS